MLSTAAVSLLAALALPGPSAPDESGTPLVAEVRVISPGSLSWRTKAAPHMTQLGRRGASYIWSVDITPLMEVVQSEPMSSLVMLPRMITPENQVAEVRTRNDPNGPTLQDFGTRPLKCVPSDGDGLPVEGMSVRIAARKIDQGTLIRLAIEDDQLLSVHSVPSTVQNTVAMTKVPEMVSTAVAGEWLVPEGRHLLVSLGAHTVLKKKDDTASANVSERLFLISVYKLETPAATGPKPLAPSPSPAPARQRSRAEITAAALDNAVCRTVDGLSVTQNKPVKTPMPSVPSRGLPLGFDPEGVHVPLPALPDEDRNVEPTSSSEPRPSPQARPRAGFTLPAISGDLNVQGGIDLIDPLPMPRVEAASLFSGNPVIKLGSLLFGPGTLDVDLRIGKPSRLTVAYKIGGVRLDGMLDPIDRTAAKDAQVRPVSGEQDTYKAIHLPSLPFMEGNVPFIEFAPKCPAEADKPACPIAKSTCPTASAGCPDKDFCPAAKPCCEDKAACPTVKPASECAKPCEKPCEKK
jgi:hypothetical protein